MTLEIKSTSLENTLRLGETLGRNLRGGEVIELISDLGGGKTALTKGIVKGLGSDDEVSSPSFVVCNTYSSPRFMVNHFDFYRLDAIGIMAEEMKQSFGEKEIITIIEWAGIAADVLPTKRIKITLTKHQNEPDSRNLHLELDDSLSYAAREMR